jgi:hypothetical protein
MGTVVLSAELDLLAPSILSWDVVVSWQVRNKGTRDRSTSRQLPVKVSSRTMEEVTGGGWFIFSNITAAKALEAGLREESARLLGPFEAAG